MKGIIESDPMYGETVIESNPMASKIATAYFFVVLPMSPLLPSPIIKISGCFDCVKGNLWTWGDVIDKHKNEAHIVCNGSYKGEEYTDLDHLYNSQNHELYLTNKRIFELGNHLIQCFKNDIIKNDEEKIINISHRQI